MDRRNKERIERSRIMVCFITEHYHLDPTALERQFYARKLNKPFVLVIFGDAYVDESFFSTVNVIERIQVPKDVPREEITTIAAKRIKELLDNMKKKK